MKREENMRLTTRRPQQAKARLAERQSLHGIAMGPATTARASSPTIGEQQPKPLDLLLRTNGKERQGPNSYVIICSI